MSEGLDEGRPGPGGRGLGYELPSRTSPLCLFDVSVWSMCHVNWKTTTLYTNYDNSQSQNPEPRMCVRLGLLPGSYGTLSARKGAFLVSGPENSNLGLLSAGNSQSPALPPEKEPLCSMRKPMIMAAITTTTTMMQHCRLRTCF